MENQYHEFIPMGTPPTVQNLKRGLYVALAILGFACGIGAIFTDAGNEKYCLIIFVVLSVLVVAMKYSGHFIINIQIDPIEGMLYSNYLTIKGDTGVDKIDIRRAKCSYVYHVTKGEQGWILTIKDNNSRLEIRETKSARNKDQKNRFVKSQLDEMYKLIMQARTG